jgi:hypothetical protein
VRNIRKHSNMFSETSHHIDIPFWGQTIPYLGEGGKANWPKKILPTPVIGMKDDISWIIKFFIYYISFKTLYYLQLVQ